MVETMARTHTKRLIAAALSATLVAAGTPALLASPSAYADDATTTAANTATQELQDGTYTLNATVVAESAYTKGDRTTQWAGWSRMFSPNIRATKEGSNYKVAIQYVGSATLDSVSIGDAAATATKTDDGTVYEGTVSSLSNDIKVTFSYNAGPMGVMSHSVYLVPSGTSAWNGFSGSAKTDDNNKTVTELTAGTYSVPPTMLNASDTSKTSMANRALDGDAIVTVAKDGTATVNLKLQPVTIQSITAYGSAVKVYSAGLGSSTSEATVVSKISGTDYPSEISFTLPPSAYQQGGVYLNMTVAGGPMSAPQDAFLALDFANAKAVKTPAKAKAKNTLKVAKSKVTVKKGKSTTVKVTKAKGAVSVKSSKKKVATVKYSKKTGKVTIKGVKKGTAKVTVTAKGNAKYAKGTKTIKVTVK